MSSAESSATRTPSPTSSLEDVIAGVNELSVSNVSATPMEQVRQFFSGMNHSAILKYALGVDHPNAPELAKETIVITMDCEKFEHEPRCLTEFGLNTFARKDMAARLNSPSIGPHGETLMKEIYFYHMRLLDKAHYVNRTFCPGDPEKNIFGVTRFVTDQEAKDFLTSMIAWPITSGAGTCPVVFLGHAVSNEIEMLRDLQVNPAAISNVVSIIDTQQIAREQGIRGRSHQIGLSQLMTHFDVAFRHGHTASNDAAYTTIAAVQMVMRDRFKESKRSLQDVVDDLESWSRQIDSKTGILKHCTRCGSKKHCRPACRGGIKRCNRCLKAGKEKAAYTHITNLCTH
jgi:hypothetical protein